MKAGESEDGECDKVMRARSVNQEESPDEVDGTKKGADSTDRLIHF